MTDGQQLFLVLTLIYLSGCFFWVDRRTVLFATWLRKRWRAVIADYRFGNANGSFYFQNPFPPFGVVLQTRILPVSVSPHAIVAYNVQTLGESGRGSQSGKVVEITSETRFTRRESELLVNGKFFCDIGDVQTAHALTGLLVRLTRSDESVRDREILAFWRERLDWRKTVKEVRRILREGLVLRWLCILAFFVFFVLLPGFALMIGTLRVVIPAAVTMVSLALLISSFYGVTASVHNPLFRKRIWSDYLKFVCCPPSSIRAFEAFSYKASAELDVLPLARILLDGSARKDFIAAYVKDLKDPDFPESLHDTVRQICQYQCNAILKVAFGTYGRSNRANQVNPE